MLRSKIKRLNELIWADRCRQPQLEAWLKNFDGNSSGVVNEQLHALHLLSRMTYFGDREIRELLRSLYRDQFRAFLVMQLRRENAMIRDMEFLTQGFDAEVSRTRFLGMGNPAESGTHLLYFFRQENQLPKNLFVTESELLDRNFRDADVKFAPPKPKAGGLR